MKLKPTPTATASHPTWLHGDGGWQVRNDDDVTQEEDDLLLYHRGDMTTLWQPPPLPRQFIPILELIVSKKFHNVACNGILALLLWVSRRSCLKFGKQVK